MRSAVWSARHWNDEGAAETCREPPVPRVPVSERKNPLHRESLDHRLRIQHKGSQRIAKSTEGWDRPACANLAPREQNPMHPETQAAQPRLRDLLETQPPSQQKPKPSKPAPTHPGTSARPKHFSRRKNLMRPETQAEQPRLRDLLETQPSSQSKSKPGNPAPTPPTCLRPKRLSRRKNLMRPETQWAKPKLRDLPETQPSSQPKPPLGRQAPTHPTCPRGRSAYPGGRTLCTQRNCLPKARSQDPPTPGHDRLANARGGARNRGAHGEIVRPPSPGAFRAPAAPRWISPMDVLWGESFI